MLAAALAPASPLPTTRTVYFRLFAGFTSFISKRWVSHLLSMGPGGMRAFSSMISPRRSRNHAQPRRRDDHREPEPDEPAEHERHAAPERVRARRAHPEASPTAPHAVIEVEAQRRHGDQVEQRDQGIAKAGGDVVVRVELHEIGMHRAGGEMQDVKDDEHQQQGPAPPDGSRRQRRYLRRTP